MRAALTAALSLAAFTAASAPQLGLPVDCELGRTCYIQQYVDHDPKATATDFRCGNLSYDGHKGTDFSLPNIHVMNQGVSVLSAAPGIVARLRDGIPDRIYSKANRTAVQGKECGNAVVVKHGNGWETQYCHMKLNSLRVSLGDRVERGTILGQIGLSGKTQFPHLHLSVRHKGAIVDPFSPERPTQECRTPETNLWHAPMPYRAGALIEVGFTSALPRYEQVLSGQAGMADFAPDSPALVLYGFAYGGQTGDVVRLEITGPDGPLGTHDVKLKKNQVRFYRAFGKRLKLSRWPAGNYTGQVTILRNTQVLSRKSAVMTIPAD